MDLVEIPGRGVLLPFKQRLTDQLHVARRMAEVGVAMGAGRTGEFVGEVPEHGECGLDFILGGGCLQGQCRGLDLVHAFIKIGREFLPQGQQTAFEIGL